MLRGSDGNFSKSPGNSYWIPALGGIQKMFAIDDLPQLIENLPQMKNPGCKFHALEGNGKVKYAISINKQ